MATKGFKTKLAIGDGKNVEESHTWTDIAKITDLKPPKPQADDIETSNMDSPGTDTGKPWKEFTAGWAEAGEVEVTIQFERAQNATVYGLFRQDKGFRITFVDGSTWHFSGYIKSFGDEVDRAKIVTTAVQIKVSGEPVFTPAVAA